MALKRINKKTTVKNYLDEIDSFLKKHPNSCFTCQNNCCARDWNIELDIVFYNRLIKNGLYNKKIEDYILINKLNRPVFKDTPCQFLNFNNLCSIYPKRPFICRAYNCKQESDNYKIIRDFILEALNFSLFIKLQTAAEKREKTVRNRNECDLDINEKNLPLNISDYKKINIYELIKSVENVLVDYRYDRFLSYFS